MVTWKEFAEAEPELAAFGLELIERYSIAHLATVRKDGGPRLHPVCPGVIEGHLYLGIIPTTPKRYDLVRDGRYVLHALPGPNDSEFFVKGRAVQIDDAEIRALAGPDGAGVLKTEDDILFELLIEYAHSAVYEMGEDEDGRPVYNSTRRRWPKVSK